MEEPISAAALMETDFPPTYIRELIESGRCYGACLVGFNWEACACPCGGEFHGAALNLEVVGPEARVPRVGDWVFTYDCYFYGVVLKKETLSGHRVAWVKWVTGDGSQGKSAFPIDQLIPAPGQSSAVRR